MTKDTAYGDGVTGRRFANVIAARHPLRQQAADWEETTASSPGAGTSSGGPADPVVARVLRTPPGHGLADQCADVANRIDQWIREGNRLARLAQRLLPDTNQVAQMLAKHRDMRQSGAGLCQRCGRDVPGIVESKIYGITANRLKEGFCYGQPPNCYAAWVRSGRRDRGRFIAEWGTDSGTPETAGPSTVDTDAVLSATSGGQLRPDDNPSGPYCEHVPPHLTDPDTFSCPVCNPREVSA